MLSHFHLIPERNGRTDKQTERQTDRFAISILRVSMLTHDKNWDAYFCNHWIEANNFKLVYNLGYGEKLVKTTEVDITRIPKISRSTFMMVMQQYDTLLCI